MQPTLSELLEQAAHHDAKIHDRHLRITKAMQQASIIQSPVGDSPDKLVLHDEDDDPFNGNLNNRRVAQRIAREGQFRRSANVDETHAFTHSNPEKAAADVAKSLAVNPEAVAADPDAMPDIALPSATPTPGSPAAKRQAAESKTGKPKGGKTAEKPAETPAPPTWGTDTKVS